MPDGTAWASRYKNNPEEVAVMCAELEKWGLEERQEGRREGESRWPSERSGFGH